MDCKSAGKLAIDLNQKTLILQMSANRLLRSHVVHVCTRDSKAALLSWATASTGTVLINGTKILGELLIADIQCTGRNNGLTKTLLRVE
jgi:hypothetical protein